MKGCDEVIIWFIFFSVFEIISLMGFIKRNDKILIKETLISYFMISAFLLLTYLFNINIPKYMIILTLITIVGDTFLGNFLDLYNKSKTFDRYLHAFGAFSFSLLAYAVIIAVTGQVINSILFGAVLVFACGMTLGAIFEISEFISDKIKKTNHQHGLEDTDYDMIFDLIGSVIAAAFSAIFIF